jgi:hypothetical protein
MTFELIETAPRLSTWFRFNLATRLDEYEDIYVELGAEVRQRWPVTTTPGAAGNSFRETLRSTLASAAMYEFARRHQWVDAADLEYLRRQCARSRRQLLRALRRISKGTLGGVGTTPTCTQAHISSQAAPPISSETHESSNALSALELPSYVYRPALRWLELYELIGKLPPNERLERKLFQDHGVQLLWDFVCDQAGVSLHHEPRPWNRFIAAPADTVGRLLPAWVGMCGCAPVDASTLEYALTCVGMGTAITDLACEWNNALEANPSQIPVSLFNWIPAHVSWYELVADIKKTADQQVPRVSSR